jgi:hypothetical protein
MSMAATPWDCLLRQPAVRLVTRVDTDEPLARPGTKLSRLLDVLAERGSCTTLTLSACTDLESRQVWGLLKAPRNIGQVEFSEGRWSLVEGFAGRDVERAAALLRDLGWRCEPPSVELSGQRSGRT